MIANCAKDEVSCAGSSRQFLEKFSVKEVRRYDNGKILLRVEALQYYKLTEGLDLSRSNQSASRSRTALLA